MYRRKVFLAVFQDSLGTWNHSNCNSWRLFAFVITFFVCHRLRGGRHKSKRGAAKLLTAVPATTFIQNMPSLGVSVAAAAYWRCQRSLTFLAVFVGTCQPVPSPSSSSGGGICHGGLSEKRKLCGDSKATTTHRQMMKYWD